MGYNSPMEPNFSNLKKLNEICNHVHGQTNPKSEGEYLHLVKAVYGDQKVQEVRARYDLFITSSPKAQLTLERVKQLQQGLNDISGRDLDQLILKLKAGKSLCEREQFVCHSLGKENVNKLKDYESSQSLPPDLFAELMAAFNSVKDQYANVSFKNDLTLDKITALPGKYIEHGWISHKKGRSLEDQERLRLYEELQEIPNDNYEKYCEIVSKILVKKHLYYEQKDDSIQQGMLIPAPMGPGGEKRWYRISEMLDTGWGKLAYRLVPATDKYADEMPELLLYRSTSSLPTALDSFTGVLSDLNIYPPGYFSKNKGVDKELEWLRNPSKNSNNQPRPLLITGHSLGASSSQLLLFNMQQKNLWADREIRLELFDSPAIKASDVEEFAKWYDNNEIFKPLTINYHVSKGDPIPLFGSVRGSSYLGNHSKKIQSHVDKFELTKTGKADRKINGLGPHGTLYLRGTEGHDYTKTRVTISQFDKEKRVARLALNLFKLSVVPITWATVGVFGGLKRLLFSRRHHRSDS